MEYHDTIQAQIEAGLLNALGSDPTFRDRVDNEQITGATMLRHNIPYDEAKPRVTQALKGIKGEETKNMEDIKTQSEAEGAWGVAALTERTQQLIQIGVYPPELEATIVKKWAELPDEIRQKLHLRIERIAKETKALLSQLTH